MKLKLATSALAACVLMAGSAMADPPKHKKNRTSSTSVAAGVTASGPQGAVAGGGAGSQVVVQNRSRRSGHTSNQTADRSHCVPSNVATTSNNTAYVDPNRASSGSSTSGTASGSGTASSTSDGYATAENSPTTGTFADASGVSTAEATRSRRC